MYDFLKSSKELDYYKNKHWFYLETIKRNYYFLLKDLDLEFYDWHYKMCKESIKNEKRLLD